MKVTAVKFIPAEFKKPRIKGFAQVQIDNDLWLMDMVVKLNERGEPNVYFPMKTSTITKRQRMYYQVDGSLRTEIVDAVIEQYELYCNVRHESDTNHQLP